MPPIEEEAADDNEEDEERPAPTAVTTKEALAEFVEATNFVVSNTIGESASSAAPIVGTPESFLALK